MRVNLEQSRLLRVVAFAFVVDTAHEGVIDAHDFPRSGQLASRALSACRSLSYTACTALREHVDKLLPNDLKLRADDSKLQNGDSKLQIGNSRLRIVDLTLSPAGSGHHLDVTKLRMGDSSVKLARGSSVSPIRSFKLAIRSFKSAIRNVPQWHAGVTPAYSSVISSTQNLKPNIQIQEKRVQSWPDSQHGKTTLPSWPKT